jgi:hypothetical protein
MPRTFGNANMSSYFDANSSKASFPHQEAMSPLQNGGMVGGMGEVGEPLVKLGQGRSIELKSSGEPLSMPAFLALCFVGAVVIGGAPCVLVWWLAR